MNVQGDFVPSDDAANCSGCFGLVLGTGVRGHGGGRGQSHDSIPGIAGKGGAAGPALV